ncbi:MAG: stage V sporulation protein G, partial [Planctomyces sp.]
VRARYCSNCGRQIAHSVGPSATPGSRTRQFADIAHPINADCRDRIEKAVLAAFHEERERSTQPGYVCRYDEFETSR